jgi:hypothetical protein
LNFISDNKPPFWSFQLPCSLSIVAASKQTADTTMSSPLTATIGLQKNAKKTSSREGLRSGRSADGNDGVVSSTLKDSAIEREYSGDTLDDLLEEEDGSMVLCYVFYAASQANLRHQVIAQIHHMIKSDPAFPADCLGVATPVLK